MMQIEQQYLNLNDVRMSQQTEGTVPPPPVVICPTEVDNVNITLEKNQQCACKDCGKLFNSVWYLKQHAVKHSNDRPFRCKFCYKTYKFRSNLYQHKCPDRTKNGNLPFNRRLMYRLTVNQSHLFDTRELSLQQTPERIAPTDFGHFLSNRPNITLPIAPIEQHTEPTDVAIEAITSEALIVKQQAEVRETIALKRHLKQAVIDNYLQKNKHKLYQCRKCKLQFPTRGYLTRHIAQHNELEQIPMQCELCPQRFSLDTELRKHAELHSRDSGITCARCCAPFRSMLALRRHRNQSRQCISSFSSFNNQTIDEYAYIDAVEAEAQMSSQTAAAAAATVTDNFSEERSFVTNDKNGDCGSASSSADCYQHFSSNRIRPEGHSSENDTSICENGSKRTITTVKIKLGSTSIVSIMKKDDSDNDDKQSLSKDRILYPELNNMEATNSEVILEEEPKRQVTQGSSTSHISRNRYSSYISSDRIISSHHSGMSGGSSSNSSISGGGGGGGNNATSNNTQRNGSSNDGESNFTTSTFDGFLSSNAGNDVYDSLMLEGGRPLILHSHVHATKVEVLSEPVVDLIGYTTQSIRDEITLCETLFTVRTHFLRKIAVYIVYITVLQTVEFFDSICGLFFS
ncbi:Zinc finger C2H2 type family protein [Acanthocheilonema viteae]